MAQMTADSDVPESKSGIRELSGEYYTHKRATLLASGVLLLVSIHPAGGLVWAPLKDLSPILVRFLALVVASYYMLHYWALHREETAAYSRSVDHGFSREVDELRAFIAAQRPVSDELLACAGRLGELMPKLAKNFEHNEPPLIFENVTGVIRSTLEVGRLGDAFVNMAMQDVVGQVNAQLAGKLSGEEISQMWACINVSFYHDTNFPNFVDQLVADLPQRLIASSLVAQTNDFYHLRDRLIALLRDAAARMKEHTAAARFVLNRADTGPRWRRFRLRALDMDVPVALFVMAVLHAAGTLWPIVPGVVWCIEISASVLTRATWFPWVAILGLVVAVLYDQLRRLDRQHGNQDHVLAEALRAISG